MIKSAYLQMSVMELIEEYSASTDTFSETLHEELKSLWSQLNDYGQESIMMWAEESDIQLPIYCK